jgi:S-adenosylmethionine:tRNA ribosyltransferase-isomerase
MQTQLFNYHLPEESIAQRPLAQRDASRMLVLDRQTGRIEHSWVRDLAQWLLPQDLFVVNRTKVLPVRLFATKKETGAKLEVFLLRPGEGETTWEALVRPARRVRNQMVLSLEPQGEVEIVETLEGGHFIVEIRGTGPLRPFLLKHGHVPLPPYIKRPDDRKDRERYQTLFARQLGSIAAPTAGLHFTPPLLASLKKRGLKKSEVLLHVGLGTFLPVSEGETEDHVMHPEFYEVPPATVKSVHETRRRGGRVVAIGTTVVRALESSLGDGGKLAAQKGETRLFITPGYSFRNVDILFTNFHQPQSTLLMLVSAFAGRERVLAAYAEALQEGYRFLSYGDAMLIL